MHYNQYQLLHKDTDAYTHSEITAFIYTEAKFTND